MGKTNIGWTEQTWNPIVGCSLKSPGCAKCYAMGMAARIEAMNAGNRALGKPVTAGHYDGTTKLVKGIPVWTGKLGVAGDRGFYAPLRRRKPTMYFVNSMSDLFHESCPVEVIDRVFAVMADTVRHTYQVLTKRSERMRAYCADPQTPQRIGVIVTEANRVRWPLPNVWLGVSAERQEEANERVPQLLQTPAAVRFVSAEPLLGPIDFTDLGDITFELNAFTGVATHRLGMRDQTSGKLDWIIAGGESGSGHRPVDLDWVRGIRDQCDVARVPFFFKQWGGRNPASRGCELDGRLHKAMPVAA